MPTPKPQIFLHRNGGGAIHGVDGAIGSDCRLDSTSEMRGAAIVSCLSEILDRSIIDGGTVVSSLVQRTISLNTHIHHAQVAHSLLDDVVVRGANDRVSDLHNVSLSNGVVVENCRLRNFELSGAHLLHVDWDKAPRNRLLETSAGVFLALTECADDHWHVGCECRSSKEWDQKESLLRRYFVGRSYGWSLEVFNSIRTTFEAWRRELGIQSGRLSRNARSIA